MKQPIFSLAVKDKHFELSNILTWRLRTFLTKEYALADKEKIPTLMNWPGREGIHFIHTLKDEE